MSKTFKISIDKPHPKYIVSFLQLQLHLMINEQNGEPFLENQIMLGDSPVKELPSDITGETTITDFKTHIEFLHYIILRQIPENKNVNKDTLKYFFNVVDYFLRNEVEVLFVIENKYNGLKLFGEYFQKLLMLKENHLLLSYCLKQKCEINAKEVSMDHLKRLSIKIINNYYKNKFTKVIFSFINFIHKHKQIQLMTIRELSNEMKNLLNISSELNSIKNFICLKGKELITRQKNESKIREIILEIQNTLKTMIDLQCFDSNIEKFGIRKVLLKFSEEFRNHFDIMNNFINEFDTDEISNEITYINKTFEKIFKETNLDQIKFVMDDKEISILNYIIDTITTNYTLQTTKHHEGEQREIVEKEKSLNLSCERKEIQIEKIQFFELTKCIKQEIDNIFKLETTNNEIINTLMEFINNYFASLSHRKNYILQPIQYSIGQDKTIATIQILKILIQNNIENVKLFIINHCEYYENVIKCVGKLEESVLLLDFSMSDTYKNLLFDYIIKEIESLNTYIIRIEFEQGSICEFKTRQQNQVIPTIFFNDMEFKQLQNNYLNSKNQSNSSSKPISIQKHIILNFKDVYLSISKMGSVHMIVNGIHLYLKWKKISIYQF